MAEFCTTNGISFYIENIITEARKNLILVSPYLQISKTLFERLKDADKRNVKITIIFGKDELKPNERNSLAELRNLNLFYFENLHAKCYFNDKKMVITSMNMYEYSEKNNREMGVYLTRGEDVSLFEKAVNETHSILTSSEKINLTKTKREYYQPRSEPVKTRPNIGYCIRCEERIKFDPERPYCYHCYGIWSQFENPDYEENYCHSCGEYEDTTMMKPLCYDCFKSA